MAATGADADHVRRAFETFNERFDALHDPEALEAYRREFYADDVVVHNAEGFPMPATYEGVAGYRQWFEDSYGPYRDVHFTIESVEPVADHVVAVARSGGRAHGDETWLEVRLAMTYALRGDRVTRVDVFLTEEAALRYVNAPPA